MLKVLLSERCDIISCWGLAGAMPRVFKLRLASMRPVTIHMIISNLNLVSLGKYCKGGTLVAAVFTSPLVREQARLEGATPESGPCSHKWWQRWDLVPSNSQEDSRLQTLF